MPPVVQVGFRPAALEVDNRLYISDYARHNLFEARCGDRVFVRIDPVHKDKEVFLTGEPAIHADPPPVHLLAELHDNGGRQNWVINNKDCDFDVTTLSPGVTLIQSKVGHFTLITELECSFVEET